MDQRARITVTGLVYCAMDAPVIEPPAYEPTPECGLSIDAGAGAVAEEYAARFPTTPEGCFLHWIFVHDWNRHIHICGRDASLTWLEPAPVAARARTGIHFPGDEVPDPA